MKVFVLYVSAIMAGVCLVSAIEQASVFYAALCGVNLGTMTLMVVTLYE